MILRVEAGAESIGLEGAIVVAVGADAIADVLCLGVGVAGLDILAEELELALAVWVGGWLISIARC